MSAAGFGHLARLLVGVADRHAGGRLVFLSEGGYDLDALEASWHAVLAACAEPAAIQPRPAGDRARGRRAVAAARAALAGHWGL
jgi:acetoin utilization deacetylase AcuC-like enzyme